MNTRAENQTIVNAQNLIDYIMDFESGELSDDKIIELFQYLIDSGQIHGLQGFYQRTAQALIDGGYIQLNKGGNVVA